MPSDSFAADEFASADLEHLAAQLGDDAARLAEKYPAPSPPELSPLTATRGNRLGLWAGVAAALGLLAGGVWRLVPSSPSAGDVARLVATSPASEDASEDAFVAPNDELPAVQFFDLSGPEQEAVLDFLEQDALAQASLSI